MLARGLLSRVYKLLNTEYIKTAQLFVHSVENIKIQRLYHVPF